uniref:Mitochondrial import inner membrane translocase subunit Tim21 n=1 Tax=Parascaris univalens TaxID=6257 RepID=A0A914ZUD2_PARUN
MFLRSEGYGAHLLMRYYFLRATSLARWTPSAVRCYVSSQNRGKDGKREPSKSVVTESGQYKSILEEVLIKEPKKPTTTAERVKEKAENTFFYAVLAASVGALGVLCYLLFEQFFSVDSPHKIYSNALSMIRADDRCEEIFGSPIAGFGEETSRGRRRHVAHQKYRKDGRDRIRVVFHLKGPRCEGLAQAEMEMVDGTWEWRFLLVQTRERPSRTCILIDNRV